MNGRQDFILGLRGVAIAAVLVVHGLTWAGAPDSLQRYGIIGVAGVDLFFVISGFCMVWPLFGPDGELRPLRAAPFLLRRLRRIGPPYWAAMVLCLAASFLMYEFAATSWFEGQSMQFAFGDGRPDVLGNLLTHATFTHGFFNDYNRALDGAFWSLATEWQFYLLLPLLVPVARRFGLFAALVVAGTVSVLYLGGGQFFPTVVGAPIGRDVIPARLVEFGVGMFAARIVRDQRRIPAATPLVAVFLFIAAYVQLHGPVSGIPFAWGLGAGLLLLAASQDNLVQRAVTSRPLLWLGQISYSLYLIHGTAFILTALVVGHFDLATSLRWPLMIVLEIPLALAAAVTLHHLVEKRAAEWSKRTKVPGRADADNPVT